MRLVTSRARRLSTRSRTLRRYHSIDSAGPRLTSAFVAFACVMAVMIGWRQSQPVAAAAIAAAPSADAPTLSDQWREKLGAQRLLMLDRLHDYWTRGEFVENPVASGGPGHFIFDGKGRPCPLASIIIASGRRDLMEQAARENNGVKVADLRSGPILEWILRSGLTQEECVLIQQPSRSGKEVAHSKAEIEKEQLTRKLEEVERTLRSANGDSLDVAVRRLLYRS